MSDCAGRECGGGGVEREPLAMAPAMLVYLFRVLDAGCSVKLHAGTEAEFAAFA